MKQLLPYFIFCLTSLFGQEPYDLNQYGKGIIDAKGAEEIDKEWHAPIKLTLVVRDEEGKPVAGAITNVGIDSSLHMDGHNNFKGKTDENGRFVVEARGGGSSDIVVVKEGYYRSLPDVEWSDKRNLDFENIKKIGFQPWNQTVEVLLKKIGKPNPMIVSIGGKSLSAPKLGEEIGYDLFIGDWVAPFGTGKTPDLLIRFDSRFVDESDYETNSTIRFSNPDDGFFPINELTGTESLLKYPRAAPEAEYPTKSLTLKSPVFEVRQFAKEKQPMGYIFRIRTKRNEADNTIISAWYGKIVGRYGASENINPFQFDTLDRDSDRKLVLRPSIRFDCYLNPNENDRNLEYDQKNNLAPDADKGVTYPP